MGRGCKLLAPVLFLLGFLLLTLLGGWPGTLLGSACIGFANGVGIPFLISEASMQAGKSAASTVMPLLSAAMYLAQFLSPCCWGHCGACWGTCPTWPIGSRWFWPSSSSSAPCVSR